VIREEADGSITVIAASFQGHRLNRPNDVVVKSDGAVYFSDPMGNTVPDQTDLAYAGVYRTHVGRSSAPSISRLPEPRCRQRKKRKATCKKQVIQSTAVPVGEVQRLPVGAAERQVGGLGLAVDDAAEFLALRIEDPDSAGAAAMSKARMCRRRLSLM
jgi:hypothetical protein